MKTRMKHLLTIGFVSLLFTTNVLAGNFVFEGQLSNGLAISFSTEPPATVAVFQRQKDGSIANYTAYESEGCEINGSKLTCPSSGKSPLAGTTYTFKKLVGRMEDCMGKPVYEIYECAEGCSQHRIAPPILKQTSVCD